MREKVDGGQAALDRFDDDLKKQKNPPKGLSRYVVPVGVDGKEIELGGLMRERLFKQAREDDSLHDESAQELLEQGLIEKRPAAGWDPREYGDGLVASASG